MNAQPTADPYIPGHGDPAYDVRHYDLDLTVRIEGNRLDGAVSVHGVANEKLDRVLLDLHHLRVRKVWIDGQRPTRFNHRGGRLEVVPARSIAAGEEFVVRVRYDGSPRPLRAWGLDFAGWKQVTDGVMVAAQPHGAPTWFPCNDRAAAKATYDLRVTVPQKYHVAGSGTLTGTTRAGSRTTWSIRQDLPMAPYLATLQIARYEVGTMPAAVPLTVVAPRGATRTDGFRAAFGEQPEMMAYFTEVFGPYPFAGYTCVITADEREIPMESQSLSTFGSNFMVDDWDRIRLVAHEMAHQWFGNAVTASQWRDIWLHEGFACYSEWLWAERSGRRPAAEWAREHHERLAGLDQDLLLGDPGPRLMFDDRVYKRGALTLHALRGEVGDDAFFRILQTWVAEHTGETVTTADLVALAERVSGRDLGPLFTAWLDERPLPPLPVG